MGWTAAAILGSSVLGAVSSIASGNAQASAANNAAAAQTTASREATALAKYQLDQTRADFAPARGVGNSALYQQSDLMGLPRAQPEAPMAQQGPGGQGQPFAGAALAEALGPTSGLFSGGGNSPLQDIQQALIQGRQISPESWAQAGLPVGGGISAPSAPLAQPMAPQASAAMDNSPEAIKARQDAAFGSFRADPGYKWAQEQGIQALDRSASAGGRVNSGGHEKALLRYGIGFGDQNFGTYYNRLAGLSGTGQAAANSVAGYGANYANNAGGNLMNGARGAGSAMLAGGDARASAYGGLATAANQGLQNYMMADYLKQPPAAGSWSPYGYAY